MSISGVALGVAKDVQGDATTAALEGAGEETLDGALLDVDVCRSGAGGSDAGAGGAASREPTAWPPFGSVVQCSSTRCNRSRMVESASSVVLGSRQETEFEPTISRKSGHRRDGTEESGGAETYERRSVKVLVTFLLTR